MLYLDLPLTLILSYTPSSRRQHLFTHIAGNSEHLRCRYGGQNCIATRRPSKQTWSGRDTDLMFHAPPPDGKGPANHCGVSPPSLSIVKYIGKPGTSRYPYIDSLSATTPRYSSHYGQPPQASTDLK